MKEQSADIERTMPIFKDGRYANPWPVDSTQIPPRMKGGILNWLRAKKNATKPAKPLPMQRIDVKQAFPENKEGLYVTLLGHSSLLVQIDGVRLLLDPVFTNNVSPVSLVNIRRFQKNAPITAEELPFIDAVFISHEHYDHLEKSAILALAPKTGYFLMPLGVGKHLRKWGVDSAKIREFTWWQEGTIQGSSGQTLRFVCTPARHFSKRTLFKHNETLWASWAFIGSKHRLFFSGDTGYGPHFKQVGHHYGPFDLTLIENGQYSIYWPYSHVTPEQGVQAHLDLQGKTMMPIHWGSFDLSIHDWWEPIERAVKAAEIQKVKLLTPQVGQTLRVDENSVTEHWWKNFLH